MRRLGGFLANSENQVIGSFRSIVIPGKVGGPCVVLFHGYGADATDLVPLTDYMNIPGVTWIFPDAPNEVIIGPGMYGKAWFQIDSRKLENALVRGETLDLSQTVPQGFESMSRQGLKFFEALSGKYSRIILGGFSQGAMLATEISLAASNPPNGLVIMSGSLINESRWTTLMKKRNTLPFFQSHGKNDAILGYEFAEKLFQTFSDSGLDGEFFAFSGGHEIPPKAIEKIASFIRDRIR